MVARDARRCGIGPRRLAQVASHGLAPRCPVYDWRDLELAKCSPARLIDTRQPTDLNESPGLDSVQPMPIKLENIGIAVRDLEATIAFFTDLGLTVLGRDTVSGEWTDTAVGLDGNHAKIAMLQTPDGNGRLELFEYIHPDAIETKPTRPNEIGMHRVAFSVDDIDEALEIAARHGCHPLRGVATYGDVYKLTYVRGPSGILVMLAEELKS
jgi:glyoxylase I family protein